MATLEEMENSQVAARGSLATVDNGEYEEQIDDEEQSRLDVQEGLRLILKAKVMLDYLGDEDMIKTITKRERSAIERISKKLGSHLENISPLYEDDEEVGGE